jgi:nitric oxide reductase subunit B
MEHGALWGHGASPGPDYTAEYRHRLRQTCTASLAEESSNFFTGPTPQDVEAASPLTARLLEENWYDPATGTLAFTPCEATSLAAQEREWDEYFRGKAPAHGLPAVFIEDRSERKDLAAYFAWAAWATVVNRPGKDYSYTNDWPYGSLFVFAKFN